jgi:hypothetical protein
MKYPYFNGLAVGIASIALFSNSTSSAFNGLLEKKVLIEKISVSVEKDLKGTGYEFFACQNDTHAEVYSMKYTCALPDYFSDVCSQAEKQIKEAHSVGKGASFLFDSRSEEFIGLEVMDHFFYFPFTLQLQGDTRLYDSCETKQV